jgi:hypothetical protein
MSVNGSLLGRDIIRREISANIELEYLSQAWVNDSWEPFARHAERLPFFYLYDLETPTQVAWAAAESVDAPAHGTPVPTMKVSMALRIVV